MVQQDDLLVLCIGDVESVGVIKKTMEQFSSSSDLFPNMGKSTIFFGSVPLDVQHEILQVMPFQVGRLLMKYLGVPLFAKKLEVNDCKSPLCNGKAKVAWKLVCLLKEQGGLGKGFLWVKWVNVVKLKGTSIWDIEANYSDSCGWKKLLKRISIIKNHVYYSIRNGKNVSIWIDRWDIKGPLSEIIPRRVWYGERFMKKRNCFLNMELRMMILVMVLQD
ncbi:hypothetical protein Tco_0707037 [Tanacetum coccineum]|uniref:Uncharacterized protein n=1 Tax=Tanacetum coccineum TaxID=301880 RepID=A0ABQ4YA58_9ASTR